MLIIFVLAIQILFVFAPAQQSTSAGESRLRCQPLTLVDGDLKCTFDTKNISNKSTNCGEAQEVGTIATYKCKLHFVLQGTQDSRASEGVHIRSNFNSARCGENGKWIGYSRFKSTTCHEECGRRMKNPTPLIINGVPTNTTAWPWHAALFRKFGEEYRYICGGSIISKSALLTAAHCVTNQNGNKLGADSTVIVLGAFSSNFTENQRRGNSQIFNVKKMFVSESYDVRKQFQSDIAILQLERDIEYNEHVSKVCLPSDFTTDSNAVSPGKLADVVGFGVDESGQISDTPRHGIIEIKTRSECFVKLSQILSESQFCAGGHRGNRSVNVCNGDSGGGLFRPSVIHEKYYIHGIVSTGDMVTNQERSNCINFTVFTRVYSFIFWIRDVLEEINSRDVILSIGFSNVFPYIQRGTETRRMSFHAFPPELRNKVTTIELSHLDVEPETLLKSLDISKNVESVNLSSIKFLRPFPTRKVLLPLLKSVSMDILMDDKFVLSTDRTFPTNPGFTKQFLNSLVFFKTDVEDYDDVHNVDFASQIIQLKINFELTIHIFKSIQIQLGQIGAIVLSQVPFANEILENILQIPEFKLEHLALSRCFLNISLLRLYTQASSIRNIIFDQVEFVGDNPSVLFQKVALDGLVEFVFASPKNTAVNVSINLIDLPRNLKHLALARTVLQNLVINRSGNHSRPHLKFPLPHSSAIVFPDQIVAPVITPHFKYLESSPSALLKLETWYCDLCLPEPDEESLERLSRLFPSLKQIVLKLREFPSNLYNILEKFQHLETALILANRNLKKFVKTNGKLEYVVNGPTKKNWELDEYFHLNYVFERKHNFWKSEDDFNGLTRLSATERHAWHTGHYRFDGKRSLSSDGSFPLFKDPNLERFETIPWAVQERLEIFEAINAYIPYDSVEKSLKFAKDLRHIRLINFSSEDTLFNRGLVDVPNLVEYRIQTGKIKGWDQFGYKALASMLDYLIMYAHKIREPKPNFKFEKDLLQSYVRQINLQYGECVIVSWDSGIGSLISGSSYTNEWLKNMNKSNTLQKLAIKFWELDDSAVPTTLTHLNLNFVVLQHVGRLLKNLRALKSLRFINVRGQSENGYKEWVWPRVHLADLSSTLTYLALERAHVRLSDSHVYARTKFNTLETLYFESCTFEQVLVQNFTENFPRLKHLVVLGDGAAAKMILLQALRHESVNSILSTTQLISGSGEREIEDISKIIRPHVHLSQLFTVERIHGRWTAKNYTQSELQDRLLEMKGISDFGLSPQCHANTFVGVRSEIGNVSNVCNDIKVKQEVIVRQRSRGNVDKDVNQWYERKNNIVVHGIGHFESVDCVRSKLSEKLQLNMKECSLTPLGKSTPDTPVPFLVKFKSFSEKIQIYKNCYRLAGTRIRIVDDLTHEQRKTRRELMPTLLQRKSEGKKVFFKGDILYVDGHPYKS